MINRIECLFFSFAERASLPHSSTTFGQNDAAVGVVDDGNGNASAFKALILWRLFARLSSARCVLRLCFAQLRGKWVKFNSFRSIFIGMCERVTVRMMHVLFLDSKHVSFLSPIGTSMSTVWCGTNVCCVSIVTSAVASERLIVLILFSLLVACLVFTLALDLICSSVHTMNERNRRKGKSHQIQFIFMCQW